MAVNTVKRAAFALGSQALPMLAGESDESAAAATDPLPR
jgi:hypothetical protein